MSESEANRFMNDLKTMPELVEKMTSVRSNPEKAFAQVKDLGYDVTKEEIREAYLEFVANELNEDQLQEVVAGLSRGATVGISVGAAVVGGAAIGAAVAGTAVMIAGCVAAGSAAAI